MSYPSVWLTSYCARIFQEANFYEWENFIFIDPQVKIIIIKINNNVKLCKLFFQSTRLFQKL